MTSFKSNVLILPGLGNSGEGHWQTIWQNKFGFTRIDQLNWDTPVRSQWLSRIDEVISLLNCSEVILVGHSLACNTIVSWAAQSGKQVKGALLVAPSDTEAPSYPPGTKGFTPMPLDKLRFPSITVTSSNDQYVSLSRAKFFAEVWGSRLEVVGEAGHINVASGHGEWKEGLAYLRELDSF